eukprot:2342440-Pleurochrysis_carterae.AAC.4
MLGLWCCASHALQTRNLHLEFGVALLLQLQLAGQSLYQRVQRLFSGRHCLAKSGSIAAGTTRAIPHHADSALHLDLHLCQLGREQLNRLHKRTHALLRHPRSRSCPRPRPSPSPKDLSKSSSSHCAAGKASLPAPTVVSTSLCRRCPCRAAPHLAAQWARRSVPGLPAHRVHTSGRADANRRRSRHRRARAPRPAPSPPPPPPPSPPPAIRAAASRSHATLPRPPPHWERRRPLRLHRRRALTWRPPCSTLAAGAAAPP